MDFTFGIITSGGNNDFLTKIVNDIKLLNIPNYEILIVGGDFQIEGTTHIPFDESIKKSWITRKKNIITENAKYDNIVYSHDYITFDINWYKGYLEHGDNFDICMNKIINKDGTRYRDWAFWPGDVAWEKKNNITSQLIIRDYLKSFLIPYSFKNLSKLMYISGAYFVVKKRVMIETPLDERFEWGDGEDVYWSLKVREKYNFSLNENSSVHLLKYKDKIFDIATEEEVNDFLTKIKFI